MGGDVERAAEDAQLLEPEGDLGGVGDLDRLRRDRERGEGERDAERQGEEPRPATRAPAAAGSGAIERAQLSRSCIVPANLRKMASAAMPTSVWAASTYQT